MYKDKVIVDNGFNELFNQLLSLAMYYKIFFK